MSKIRAAVLGVPAVIVVIVAFSPATERMLGFGDAFMPAGFAAIFLIEMMTAYLLWQQFGAQGDIRLLGLSLTYLFTGLLLIPNVLTNPYALHTTGPLGGTPSTTVWLWLIWHIAFPVGLAVALAPWPERAVLYVRDHPRKVGRRAAGAVLLTITLIAWVFSRGLGTVPVLGGALDFPRMAGTLGPLVVLISVVSLIAVYIESRSNRPLERWILVAAAATACDSLLTVTSGARFTLGWHLGRTLALAATGVVLMALTREIGHLYRDMLVSNQELRELNERDALTGVYSRRAILERADALMHDPGEISIAVIDLDQFKAVNDSHGHPIGDDVLIWVSKRMATCLRAGDVVGRLGGEEFVVLLPGADSRGAANAGERIRRALTDSTIATAAGHLRITASIGTATRTPDDLTLSSILGRADAAMYRAKAAGRNQVKASEADKVLVEH